MQGHETEDMPLIVGTTEKEEPDKGHLESGRQPKDAIGNASHGNTAVTTAFLSPCSGLAKS